MTNTERPTTEPVVGFLQEARAAAGGTAQLANLIGAHTGHRPDQATIQGWLRGERQPRVAQVRAIVRSLHSQGVSFDRWALMDSDEVDQRPLQEQIAELRAKFLRLEELMNLDRANRMLPPIDYPPGVEAG